MSERVDFQRTSRVLGPGMLAECHRQEIERAVTNAKRSAWDKWFRRQWYRAAAQSRKRYSRQHSSHRPMLSGARRW